MLNIGDNFSIDGLYNTNSEGYSITIKIIEEFYNEIKFNNSIPIVLIFPNRDDVMGLMNNKPSKYSPFIDFLENNDFQYIDLIEVFKDLQLTKDKIYNELFITHYSVKINELVAQNIILYLGLKHGI